MKKMVMMAAIIPGLLFSNILLAGGDAAAGKKKSESCTGCHGMNGKSNNPAYPNLAGQKGMYLEKAIKAYKTGERKDAMMGSFVSALSDQDIADLAAFYAGAK